MCGTFDSVAVAVYPVMVDPPLFEEGVHDTVIFPSPGVATMLLGGSAFV